MGEVDEDFEAFEDDLVRGFAFNVGDKSNAAGVVFVGGVVEALRGRKLIHGIDWVHLFLFGWQEGEITV
jgi:hypothetical protein